MSVSPILRMNSGAIKCQNQNERMQVTRLEEAATTWSLHYLTTAPNYSGPGTLASKRCPHIFNLQLNPTFRAIRATSRHDPVIPKFT